MVRIEDHEKRMQQIKAEAANSKGKKKQQLMKHYHRLLKQLLQCQLYIKGGN